MENIAIELGSCFTRIFVSKIGVVLCENTIIAFDGEKKQKNVRAIGRDAYSLIDKMNKETMVIKPIANGVVKDLSACSILLKEFLKKIAKDGSIYSPKYKAIIAVPMGLRNNELMSFKKIVSGSTIKELHIIQKSLMDALGAGIDIDTKKTKMIVSIGGGTSEIALINNTSIVSGVSLSVGGNKMDVAICDKIAGKYKATIALNQATLVKNQIASLYKNDRSSMKVVSIDIETKDCKEIEIFSNDILESIEPYYANVLRAVQNLLKVSPKASVLDIKENGVLFCGGASQILGFDVYAQNFLQMPVQVVNQPDMTTIFGCGSIVDDDNYIGEINKYN